MSLVQQPKRKLETVLCLAQHLRVQRATVLCSQAAVWNARLVSASDLQAAVDL